MISGRFDQWAVRGLHGLGRLVVVWVAWPVMKSAWQAQRPTALRRHDYRLTLDALLNVIDRLGRAVEMDPTASRYFQRPSC